MGAAELQAAAQRTGPIAAESFMSRDLVTVGPNTPAEDVAMLFRRHRFTSIPVVEDGRYIGVIFQIHLIGANATDSAVRLMQADVPHATPQAPIGALLPMISDGDVDAVPIADIARQLLLEPFCREVPIRARCGAMMNVWSLSVVALNLHVLSTMIPFSRISRPTLRCSTSTPNSFNSSVILGRP